MCATDRFLSVSKKITLQESNRFDIQEKDLLKLYNYYLENEQDLK